MKKGNKKGVQTIPGIWSNRCPYCGSSIVLRSAEGIYKENDSNTMLYVCSRYPVCDAYIRIKPGTRTPVGSMADGNLRALRREAHRHFDRLHLAGLMSRKEAYEWLAAILQAPLAQAHIGYLGEYYCRQVIEESKRLIENRCKARVGLFMQQKERGGEIYAVK